MDWNLTNKKEQLYENGSVAPIQQFAYMPIFHNPNCLHVHADPKAWKLLCKLYRQCIGNAVAYTDTLPLSSI